mmetsp:Transcript_23062/g.26761  ORF Transcript_23062/g.26761 Transcript_23062/m.26761 type:complete len:271 (-) Transcript_23062:50-862(-)
MSSLPLRRCLASSVALHGASGTVVGTGCSQRVAVASSVYLTSTRWLSSGRLSTYAQEAFEASKQFHASKTYPGSIRAATPGDTRFYIGHQETVVHMNERHYWRAVIDDPQVEPVVTLRVRLRDDVWVTNGWETRMRVIQVVVPRGSTVAQVIEQVVVDNDSPYLCQRPIGLAVDGRELNSESSIDEYHLNENSIIDAIDVQVDHVKHLAEHRPKDWNIDEITDEDMLKSPYKEMSPVATANLIPRYEAQPAGLHGRRNYGPVRPDPKPLS